MLNILVENHTLTVFVVLLLGFLIGSVRIFGFSLGSAGVLFAGLTGLLFLGTLLAAARRLAGARR